MKQDIVILEHIYENDSISIHRAKEKSNGKKLIRKASREGFASPEIFSMLKHEYDLITRLNLDGIPKPAGIQEDREQFAFFFEDIGGISLNRILASGSLDISFFLAASVKISKILGDLHSAKLIHKDIKPSNIIVNRENIEVQIIDFGISTFVSKENMSLVPPEMLEGTLSYISPEQTGRMNRHVDYRTDMYSLGITFYEMLAGHPPFFSEDSMEMIHFHIAVNPKPLHELNPSIPKQLSEIISKLLSKKAEERYQSAYGLMYDLQKCKDLYDQEKDIAPFRIAEKDHSGKLQIPQKLYGRDKETKILLDIFDSMMSAAAVPYPSCLLIAGYSGVGKSSIVHEIHRPITERRGIFVSGKFDQYQKNIPYYAVTQIFNEFCGYLLGEKTDVMEKWKTEILAALGDNAGVLFEVIPDLELLLGRQKEVPTLGAGEAQNRFNFVFQNFLQTICKKEHPLVLFIDDLQWADNASLNLIKNLLLDSENRWLFLIGAYRDNEVSPSHPFMLSVSEIEKIRGKLPVIELKNLLEKDAASLLCDAFSKDHNEISDLLDILYSKTAGNAFFMGQFLETMYEDGLLRFSHENGWNWDLNKIQEKNISNNVVDLMVSKLSRLPEAAKNTVQTSSIIGNSFYLSTIAVISGKTEKEILSILWPAVEEGFILPLNESYRLIQSGSDEKNIESPAEFKFLHDRVQQAAYSMIEENRGKSLHLQIGRLLLSNTEENRLEDRIFEIVSHFNHSLDLLNHDEIIKIADLNLKAGRKAKLSTAYSAALEYLKKGIEVLGTEGWTQNYRTMFDLHREISEAAFLSGKFEESDKFMKTAVSNSASEFDRASIYTVQIAQLSGQARYPEAVAVAIEGLNSFGMNIPRLEEKEKLQEVTGIEIQRILENLKKLTLEEAFHLPMVTDKKIEACQELLYVALDGIVIALPELLALFPGRLINLSIEYGFSKVSPMAFSFMAIVWNSALKNYKSAFEFVEFGLKLNEERIKNPSLKAKIFHLYAYYSLLRFHLSEGIKYQRATYLAGQQYGDFVYGSYGLYLCSRFATNLDLNVIKKDAAGTIQFFQKINNQAMIIGTRMVIGFARSLGGENKSKLNFDYEDFTEQQYYDAFFAAAPVIYVFFLRYKFLAAAVFGEYSEGLNYLRERSKWIPVAGAVDLMSKTDYHFATGITASHLYETASDELKKELMEAVEESVSEMKLLAEECPVNFFGYYKILSGEKNRIVGNEMQALSDFEEAVSSGKENGFSIVEAFGNQMLAEFWEKRNNPRLVKIYASAARQAYKIYGANAKAKDIAEKYLLTEQVSLDKFFDQQKKSRTISAGSMSSGTILHSSQSLDIYSIIKSSNVIAQEIHLEKLTGKILQIILETAGAGIGFFITPDGAEFLLEASLKAGEEVKRYENRSILQSGSELPLSIIHYAVRTKRYVVLDNASDDKRFQDDEYIKQKKVLSILCIPIVTKSEIKGIVYLENSLVNAAFPPSRIETIQLISGQAAISIDNARLYANLEKATAERSRIQTEMAVAQKIQTCLLPRKPSLEGYEVCAFMKTADEVGGDYYDTVKSEKRQFALIGDVSGHGVTAGLVMMMAQTSIHTIIQSGKDLKISEMLSEVNRAQVHNISLLGEDKYMTFMALEFFESGKVLYSGAHQDVLVVRSETGKVEKQESRGFWLGLEEDISPFLMDSEFHLKDNDFIFLYTDGVTEAEKNGQLFGLENLCSVLENSSDRKPEEIRDSVLSALQTYRQSDDVSFVIIKKNRR